MVTALAICVAIPYNSVFAQEKTHYTHRTTCACGTVIEVPVTCVPNQQVTVEVHCPGETSDRVTWRCPDDPNQVSDKLILGLRGGGFWGEIPGPGSRDTFYSFGGEGILQLRNFLGPAWGLEFATGFGGGWYPNSERVFYAQAEGGVLWHPGKFELMAGYNAGIGSTTDEVVLHRHTGVLWARYFFWQRFGLEAFGQVGWGRQAWDIDKEEKVEKDGKPFWHTWTETSHYSGLTWVVGLNGLWRW